MNIQKSLYDQAYRKGFKDGNNFMFDSIVELSLKCVMVSLYNDEFPCTDIMTVKEQITDAIFYYGAHPKEMDALIKEIEEETGMDLKFHADGREREIKIVDP